MKVGLSSTENNSTHLQLHLQQFEDQTRTL